MPTPAAYTEYGRVYIDGDRIPLGMTPEEAVELASALISACNEANGYPRVTAATQIDSNAGILA
jgi:hypothetical protein